MLLPNKSNNIYDDLIGKPFELYSYGPDKYDCYGLVSEISSRLGNPIPDWKELSCDFVAALKKGKEIFLKIEKPEVGDLVLIEGLGDHPHFGIVINNVDFLHTSEKIGGVVKTNLSHPFYKFRMKGFYRYVGI